MPNTACLNCAQFKHAAKGIGNCLTHKQTVNIYNHCDQWEKKEIKEAYRKEEKK